MNSIVYVGMDVHKKNFSVCCYTVDRDEIQYQQNLSADYKMVLKYLEGVRKHFPDDAEYVFGYEAGCLGYSLYHQLTDHGLKCIILAPTTMGITNTNRVKTDRKDAGNIARCLAFRTYSEVHVPTEEDDAIKEFIRMKDDQRKMLKSIKQEILALVLRHGMHYDGGKCYWTIAHMKWLKSLDIGAFQETLDEYLITLDYLIEKIDRLDARIEELASADRYQEKVKQLSCFIGVKTHTALSMIVEVGDFERFSKAEKFASYLGLVPSEDSSGGSQNRYSITKAGNGHLRRLLVEAAQGYSKGTVGHKSMALKKRQQGNAPQVIAYADKANERLRRRFYTMTLKKGVNRNVVITAIARELACFMWGMMTGNIA